MRLTRVVDQIVDEVDNLGEKPTDLLLVSTRICASVLISMPNGEAKGVLKLVARADKRKW